MKTLVSKMLVIVAFGFLGAACSTEEPTQDELAQAGEVNQSTEASSSPYYHCELVNGLETGKCVYTQTCSPPFNSAKCHAGVAGTLINHTCTHNWDGINCSP